MEFVRTTMPIAETHDHRRHHHQDDLDGPCADSLYDDDWQQSGPVVARTDRVVVARRL